MPSFMPLSTPKKFSDDQMSCMNPGQGRTQIYQSYHYLVYFSQGHTLWDRKGEHCVQTEQIYFVNEIITCG